MKKYIALVLCLILCLGLVGCVAEDREFVPSGGQLIMDTPGVEETPTEAENPQELTFIYYSGRSMNPFTATDYTNRALFSLIYQGLFSTNRDYETVPILCDRYTVSEDMKTYTFYLVDGATFSDGTPVTIKDVQASYYAAQDTDYYSGRFTHVEAIWVEGESLIFRLDTPMENLPILLDIPVVKATEVGAAAPLGTGPYTLNSTITSAYLRRVGSWWCADQVSLPVTADSIPLLLAESPAQIRDEFEFYDLDLVCTNPCSDLYADYRCDYELWNCENGEMIFLACNVAYREIFSTPTLRSALTYAIDRTAIIEKYYQGFARAVTLPASTYFPHYSDGLDAKYQYNPEKFAEAMQNVTLMDRDLVLLVNEDDTLRLQTARDIAIMLTEQGLPTTVNAQDTKSYMEHILAGNYDMYLGCTRLSANMDLSAFFRSGGSLSYNGIANEALYQRCLDALENHGTYYNLHQAVAEDGRIVPLIFCGYAVYATRGLLSDLEPARDNVFYYELGRTLEDALVDANYSS